MAARVVQKESIRPHSLHKLARHVQVVRICHFPDRQGPALIVRRSQHPQKELKILRIALAIWDTLDRIPELAWPVKLASTSLYQDHGHAIIAVQGTIRTCKHNPNAPGAVLAPTKQ